MKMSIGKELQGGRVSVSLALAFAAGETLSDRGAARLLAAVRSQLAAAADDQVESVASALARVDPALHDVVRKRADEKMREAEEEAKAEIAAAEVRS